jgi:hypothetical protein
LHLLRAVLFVDGLSGKPLVLIEKTEEGFIATDTWSNCLKLVVIPLLLEDMLDLRAGPPLEGADVKFRARLADEYTIGKCRVSSLCTLAVHAEFIVWISCQLLS